MLAFGGGEQSLTSLRESAEGWTIARMSASAPEMDGMADRVGPAASEDLRTEHVRLAAWGAGVERFATGRGPGC